MRPVGRAVIGAGIAGALLAPGTEAASGAPEAAKTPAALVSALRKAKVTSLPHGYKKPVVMSYALTAAAKDDHAVGGVAIEGDSGKEAVIYLVFANAADAKLDWENGNFKGVHTAAAPASIPKPSLVVSASSTAKSGASTYTIGLTDVTCLSGNVIVEGVTSSLTDHSHGDLAGAVALARFALSHLRALSSGG